MAKKTKETEVVKEGEAVAPAVETPSVKEEEAVPSKVLELMRLYPQLEKLYVTPKGFVHPDGAPAYITKNAKLYTNKYYKK